MSNDDISEQRKLRPEVGAIWKRTSKQNGGEYMTIRLRLTKERLEELLLIAEEGQEVEYDLVSFPNSREENDRRPSFRVYEDLS